MSTKLALSARAMAKSYPGVRALAGVDLDLRYGEVHALCGGNGSGKSTLIKLLAGVVPGDEGTVEVGGQKLNAAEIKPRLVYELGVRVVHQDLAVFPDLSVAENMMLGASYPTRSGCIRRAEVRRRALAQLERFEINTRPDTLVRDLPVAIRTQVAIARALQDVVDDRAVVILDEPTASLPAHEARVLLDAIRKLAAQGHAILFVSHRLDEVLALTDRVTVLRDGHVFAEHQTSTLTENELIESIIGRSVETGRALRSAPDGRSVLSVTDLWSGPLRGVSLNINAGEVVGIAGLLGSGRTELLRTIWGDLPTVAGSVCLNGREVHFTRNDQAVGAGVVMIPEDRVNGGAFADLTLDENMNISVLNQYWVGRFLRGKMREDASELRRQFRVKAPSGSVAMKALSGGNQQKAIMARWLRRDPVLLLLDEPTQGVDVGSRADIYAAVRQVTEAGGAALVVTSDLEELAQVVDRAFVLRDGRVVADVPYHELSAQRLNEEIYTKRVNNA